MEQAQSHLYPKYKNMLGYQNILIVPQERLNRIDPLLNFEIL